MKLHLTLALITAAALAQTPRSEPGPTTDTTVLDRDGTARITRVVPIPKTVSLEAQELLATGASWAPGLGSPEEALLIDMARKLYPVKEEDAIIGGVKVRHFIPANIPPNKRDRILIELHAGGFRSDMGSLLESIPIASLTQTHVIAVYYRMAPENVFPAAVDDVVAVYKEILKTHRPSNVAIFGTSAGAELTAEVSVRLKHDVLPQPASYGIFSGSTDSRYYGDTQAFFATPGLPGARIPRPAAQSAYIADHDPSDPLASPILADLRGLPPTLCIAGTRDFLMSGTVNHHRALLRAGVDARLVIFEAMPHAFWFRINIPEAKEAVGIMARFFDETVGKKP